jgi:hypothetical protein
MFPRLIQAAMRLHSFLLNEGQCGFYDESNKTQASIHVLSVEELLDNTRHYQRFKAPAANVRWKQALRESILNEIKDDGLQRPQYNRLRNVRRADLLNSMIQIVGTLCFPIIL